MAENQQPRPHFAPHPLDALGEHVVWQRFVEGQIKGWHGGSWVVPAHSTPVRQRGDNRAVCMRPATVGLQRYMPTRSDCGRRDVPCHAVRGRMPALEAAFFAFFREIFAIRPLLPAMFLWGDVPYDGSLLHDTPIERGRRMTALIEEGIEQLHPGVCAGEDFDRRAGLLRRRRVHPPRGRRCRTTWTTTPDSSISSRITLAYLDRAEPIIHVVSEELQLALKEDGSHEAHAEAPLVMSRILEREGVWNYVVSGSLTDDVSVRLGLRAVLVPGRSNVQAARRSTARITGSSRRRSRSSTSPSRRASIRIRSTICLPKIVWEDNGEPATAEMSDILQPQGRQADRRGRHDAGRSAGSLSAALPRPLRQPIFRRASSPAWIRN